MSLKPQTILSLVIAGAFYGTAPNREEALWWPGSTPGSTKNGQMSLPLSTEDCVTQLQDFTGYDRMAGEYQVMGVYPRGTPDGVHKGGGCAPSTPLDEL